MMDRVRVFLCFYGNYFSEINGIIATLNFKVTAVAFIGSCPFYFEAFLYFGDAIGCNKIDRQRSSLTFVRAHIYSSIIHPFVFCKISCGDFSSSVEKVIKKIPEKSQGIFLLRNFAEDFSSCEDGGRDITSLDLRDLWWVFAMTTSCWGVGSGLADLAPLSS